MSGSAQADSSHLCTPPAAATRSEDFVFQPSAVVSSNSVFGLNVNFAGIKVITAVTAFMYTTSQKFGYSFSFIIFLSFQ